MPFVISERSIDDWVAHFNRLEDGMQSPVSSLSTTPRWDGQTSVVGSQDRSVEEWGIQRNRSEENVISSPSSSPSTSPVSEGNPLLNQLEAWCEQNEHDEKLSKDRRIEHVPQVVTNPHPMRNPVEPATPFSETMAKSNDSYSQLYEQLHQVQVGKELVRLVYQEHMERLAAEKAKLVKTAKAVLEAQRVLDTVIRDTRGVSEEVNKLLEFRG